MSARKGAPNLSVIGIAEVDVARDVASFFAAHPFDVTPPSLDLLPVEAFFRVFFEAPRSHAWSSK